MELSEIKSVRNALIGSRTRKEAFVNEGSLATIERMMMNQAAEVDILVELAIVVGSIAHGGPTLVDQIWKSTNIVSQLFVLLDRKDERLIVASLKALRVIFRYSETMVIDAKHIQLLILLLDEGVMPGAVLSILSHCQEHYENMRHDGIISRIETLISVSTDESLQRAAVDFLASISNGRPEISLELSNKHSLMELLAANLHAKDPMLRLLSAAIFSNLYSAGTPWLKDVSNDLVLSLVRLLTESVDIQNKACIVLAHLLSENSKMQNIAGSYDTVSKLASIIDKHLDESMNTVKFYKLKANCFLAVAAICAQEEYLRDQVINSRILHQLVPSLKSMDADVRAAACQCTRSLTRSLKNLRTVIVDIGVAAPLVSLLSDKELIVQITATAALCNLVLEFSPVKASMFANGAVAKLVELSHSFDPDLKLNALWALKNFIYKAPWAEKQRVMQLLGYSYLKQLLVMEDIRLQEQAINLFRNLACGKLEEIEAVFLEMGGEDIIEYLVTRMSTESSEIVKQATFVLVNLCTSTVNIKNSILNHPGFIEKLKIALLTHETDIKLACVWCIINLSWKQEENDKNWNERRDTFINCGFVDILNGLSSSKSMDLTERARVALSQLEI